MPHSPAVTVDDEHAPTPLPTTPAPFQESTTTTQVTSQPSTYDDDDDGDDGDDDNDDNDDDYDDDMIPPKEVVYHSFGEEVVYHSFGEEVLDSFTSLSNDFNKLDRLGKSRLLPYLLHWLTKRDVKYYISVVGKESKYTENQATIIDRFNLLPEKKRRAMFPKVAAYFILQDIDYRVIEDDNWQSPFIQRVAS
jgi:hypothetical protein